MGLNGIEGKSGASFCRQTASWVPDMFCNFYFVKNHKIVKNSTTTKAIEKLRTDLESIEFLKNVMHVLLNLKKNQILLNKISHGFLLATKLFTQ